MLVGSTEMGQGQRTAFAQIAAEVLGMRRRNGSDASARTPSSRPTTGPRAPAAPRRSPASRSSGPRRRCATTCWTSRARSGPGARRRIELRDGAAWCGDGARTFPELIAKRFGLSGGQLIGEGGVHPEGTGSYAEGPVFWEVCIGAAEVHVDRDTGMVTVDADRDHRGRGHGHQPPARGAPGRGRHDAGHRQRPVRGDGVRARGLLVNDDLLDYRIPDIEDLPQRSACVIVENGDGPGPFGAKGCGEGPSPASSAPSPRRSRMPECP